jgi:hypothetical protein
MEASTRVIPLLHHYPVSTEPEELWEHGNVHLHRLDRRPIEMSASRGRRDLESSLNVN